MATLKDALPRAESELGRNRAEKGDKSYYYAHNEGWHVPGDAIVRTGEGIITGGAPVKLGPDGKPVQGSKATVEPTEPNDPRDEVISQLRARIEASEKELMQLRGGSMSLTQFSYSDDAGKCKVYVEAGSDVLEKREALEAGITYTEAAVTVTFAAKSCCVRVMTPSTSTIGAAERRAATFVFESEIVPEKCAFKVDRSKGRITLTLKKLDEEKKWKKGPTTQAS